MMWMVPLISVHQGMAFGAAGVILCAVSDVRPAITAVQSRFENLAQPPKQTHPRPLVDVAKSIAERKSINGNKKLKSVVEKSDAPTATEAWISRSANFRSPGPDFDSHTGPVLSIKSTRRAEDFGLGGSQEVDSDEVSWTSSEGDSDTSDYDSNSDEEGLSSKLAASKSMAEKMALVALSARRHAPSWHVDTNPVTDVLGLFVGLMSLFFIALTSSVPATFGRVYKANARHVNAILPAQDIVEEGDEML